jgi:hypothetical protein
MRNMKEQKYLVIRAKAPRKRKIERFEIKFTGGNPILEAKDFINNYKLRDVQSVRIIPYLIDDSVEGLTMRTLLPSGIAEEVFI